MGGGLRHGGQLGSLVLLGVAVLLILRPWEEHGAQSGPREARAFVVRAVDGDTIEVRIGGRLEDVRYIGGDMPQTVKPDTAGQCFGPRASNFNHHLVERRWVRLVFGVERRDIYGRLLAYVYLNHRFVNASLA